MSHYLAWIYIVPSLLGVIISLTNIVVGKDRQFWVDHLIFALIPLMNIAALFNILRATFK